jgi:hypothetical protein
MIIFEVWLGFDFAEYRKLSSEKRAWITPTYLPLQIVATLNNYGKKCSQEGRTISDPASLRGRAAIYKNHFLGRV